MISEMAGVERTFANNALSQMCSHTPVPVIFSLHEKTSFSYVSRRVNNESLVLERNDLLYMLYMPVYTPIYVHQESL